jgi:hypothetical protein
MVSSLTLAFEDVSLDHAPIKRKVIDCLNNFYTVVFLMELILKMFAFGVAGYFSSAWHWLDSIVVAVSNSLDSSTKQLSLAMLGT